MKLLPNRREATLALYEDLERGELSPAECCRRMRRILGLTQAAYAELVGISAPSVGKGARAQVVEETRRQRRLGMIASLPPARLLPRR